jgi:hypothetical protein
MTTKAGTVGPSRPRRTAIIVSRFGTFERKHRSAVPPALALALRTGEVFLCRTQPAAQRLLKVLGRNHGPDNVELVALGSETERE